VPQGLSNVVAIAAGAYHSVAVGANVPPKALPLNLALKQREPLVIHLAVVDPNNDPLTLLIKRTPAGGHLFQCDNGLMGAEITAPGTVVTDPGRRVILLPADLGLGDSPATFEYSAVDDEAEGASAVASIRLVSPEPAKTTGFGWSTNGAFRVTFTGDSNLTQCVQVSTNLVDWDYLGIAGVISSGVFQLFDWGATNSTQRFYRVDSGCTPARGEMVGFSKVDAGTFEVKFNGDSGGKYRVWGSKDLQTWTPLGYASEVEPGLFRFLDVQLEGVPRRFYRAGAN
jgi:hypothetical protein